MRSSRSWLSTCIAIAVVLAACSAAERDYHHELYTFGTYVSVSFYAATEEQNQEALASLEALFGEVDDNWYPWAPGELQRINNAIAAGEAIAVSRRLQSLIIAATDYELLSRGRFNAGLGRLTELWHFHDIANPPATLPDAKKLAALLHAAPALASLSWHRDELTGHNREVMIDLGGIAKGAILEDCTDLLRTIGIDNAIINIGGDLVVIGQVGGRAARIGIRSPLIDAPVAGLDIADGEAVFTSGSYERFVEIDGTRYTHILDPRTGFPVEHTVSVTVVSDDPERADAAATALMVGGADEFNDLVEALQLDYALLVDAGGDTRLTPGMRERLKWLDTP
jgi:thiamine biosynthesis lipoprotein